MKSSDLPRWVLKWKKPGTTIKAIGGSYYLYRATSKRVPGRSWPVSIQTYIGKITEEGVVEAGIRIIPSETKAALLKDIAPGAPEGHGDEIFILADGRWHLTQTEKERKASLEKLGLVRDGVLASAKAEEGDAEKRSGTR